MNDRDARVPREDGTPEELRDTADWLRAQRPEVSALELDRLRMRARQQAASAGSPSGSLIRPRRALSTIVTVVALTIGLGGAFALAGKAPPFSSGSPNSNGSAAQTQYKPGKGCGDANHQHEREGECKKPPK